jgi:lactate dehydrogenase-like 2-hydroxyacid dehydrogenase
MNRAVREKLVFPRQREIVKGILYPIFRMRGQTLGIIGFGKIRTTVALKARFGVGDHAILMSRP